MSGTSLAPETPFCRAVFTLVRPHIPRERWPADSVLVRVSGGGDGLWLDADFDGFPRAQARLAADLVRQAGWDLVALSPLALSALAVMRAKRWRDFCLYAFLPLLFAIPLMGSLSDIAMTAAGIAFAADVVGLAVTQGLLGRARATMQAAHFIAHVPAPGRKMLIASQAPDLKLSPLTGV